jgi:hypothetical protein
MEVSVVHLDVDAKVYPIFNNYVRGAEDDDPGHANMATYLEAGPGFARYESRAMDDAGRVFL